MKIRKFKEEDAEEKTEMHLSTIREVNSQHYSEEQIEAWTTFDSENYVEETEKEKWVAEEDGKIIGFGDYIPMEAEITGVYVHPDHLRKGIGSKLLEKMEQAARDQGIEKLTCVSSLTAKEFYRNHGYKVKKQIKHETSGEELEAYKMEKEL